ncbi:hypothetical protein GY45DRAFT_645656 [Cubamyces sp. BRFM 1775]|nr:hypothetical protein GY45DRAFT_645656 [Cubamyces sp. BRFM 1775]
MLGLLRAVEAQKVTWRFAIVLLRLGRLESFLFSGVSGVAQARSRLETGEFDTDRQAPIARELSSILRVANLATSSDTGTFNAIPSRGKERHVRIRIRTLARARACACPERRKLRPPSDVDVPPRPRAGPGRGERAHVSAVSGYCLLCTAESQSCCHWHWHTPGSIQSEATRASRPQASGSQRVRLAVCLLPLLRMSMLRTRPGFSAAAGGFELGDGFNLQCSIGAGSHTWTRTSTRKRTFRSR